MKKPCKIHFCYGWRLDWRKCLKDTCPRCPSNLQNMPNPALNGSQSIKLEEMEINKGISHNHKTEKEELNKNGTKPKT